MLREEFSGLFIGGSIFAFQAGQSILQFVCSEEQRRNSEQAQQPNPETYSHFTAPWRPGEFSGTQTALTIILLPTRAPELKGYDRQCRLGSGELAGAQTALTIILLPTRAPELKGYDRQ